MLGCCLIHSQVSTPFRAITQTFCNPRLFRRATIQTPFVLFAKFWLVSPTAKCFHAIVASPLFSIQLFNIERSRIARSWCHFGFKIFWEKKWNLFSSQLVKKINEIIISRMNKVSRTHYLGRRFRARRNSAAAPAFSRRLLPGHGL